jgi:hypothetical protein
MGCLFLSLLKIEYRVSEIGIPSANIGIIKDRVTVLFNTPKMETVESKYPNIIDPESPMKIFAGAKLYRKKPKLAPSIAINSNAATGWFV